MNFARTLLNGAMLGAMLGLAAAAPSHAAPTAPANTSSFIDYGDDSSDWAKDGECDDPRFTGTGVAGEVVAADIKRDATDCLAAVTAGKATLKPSGDAITTPTPAAPTPAPAPAPAPAAPKTPAAPAAAGAVDFGDDTSQWAKDGECDDPRFGGAGAAAELDPVDASHDATDCKAAVAAGTVTFKGDNAPGTIVIPKPADTPAAPPATNTGTAAIDFGDDSSQWAKDGECDDPRFGGAASAQELETVDVKHDATDCKAAVQAGTVTFKGNNTPGTIAIPHPADTPAAPTTTPAAVDFGDDASQWAKDGECDDPRFTGAASAEELEAVDIKHDATDCKAAFNAGTVTLKTGGADTPATDTPAANTATTGGIDFGDDSSEWSRDGECDDPRFTGTGVSSDPATADVKKDAFDCKAAVEAGTATLKDGDTPAANTPSADTPATDNGDAAATDPASIDFGDDEGQYPRDGECDDPRFTGTALSDEPQAADIKHDATDCRAAFGAGTVTLKSAGATSGIDFGSDTSQYARDGECDDPRFTGPGADKKLLSQDKLADATDCRALAEDGKITLRPVFDPGYIAGAPFATSGIDFGDNTSSYANDDECDDPRFEGPGLADNPVPENKWHDHDDCIAAFEKGTVALKL